MDKKILAIAAVAIIIVAACAVVVATGGSNSKDDGEQVKITDRLLVYGNANSDDYLDERDVTFLEELVKDPSKWDKTKNPYADTDNDGKITQNDVDVLKKFLNKEKSTMYYTNVWGGVSSVHYPVTGKLGTMYWEQACMTVVLGIWDRVAACGYGSLTEQTNPGWDKLYSYGKGYNADVEVMMAGHEAAGVDAIIAYTQSDGTAKDLIAAVEKAKMDMDVIAAPTQVGQVEAILTLGVLLGAEERAQEYAGYCDQAMDYVNDTLKDVKDKPTVMLCMIKNSANTGDILVLGPASQSTPNGLYTYMSQAPVDLIIPENYVDFYTSVTAEWIAQQNPDYIIALGPGVANTADMDDAQLQSAWEDRCKELFGATDAYKNGHIVGLANGVMNSAEGGFAYPALLSHIFPQIDKEKANEFLKLWEDKGFIYYKLADKPTYTIRDINSKA